MAKRKSLVEEMRTTPAEAVQADRDKRTAKLAYDALAKQYKEALGKIEQQNEQIELLTALEKRKPVKGYSAPKHKSKSDATAIVFFSDWHVGEVVKPDQSNGLNEYNTDIAEKRAKAVTERALMMLEHERGLANIDRIIVCLGGDFMTGWLHPENEQTNALGPIEEALFAGDLLEKTLRTFQEKSGCKSVTIPTCIGNHGRITKKMQAANASETNHETGIYLHLRRRFPDWDWRISKSYHKLVQVAEYRLRFHHGDAIRYQGGIGGMTVPVIRRILRVNNGIKADYDMFGHLHQYNPSSMFACNGSLIGYNAYAERSGFDPQEPLQTFAICDHKRGITKVTQLFTD